MVDLEGFKNRDILPLEVQASLRNNNQVSEGATSEIIKNALKAAEYDKNQIIKEINTGLLLANKESIINDFITPASDAKEINYIQEDQKWIWNIIIENWEDQLEINFNFLYDTLLQSCKFKFTPKNMYIKRQLELLNKFNRILDKYKDKISYKVS